MPETKLLGLLPFVQHISISMSRLTQFGVSKKKKKKKKKQTEVNHYKKTDGFGLFDVAEKLLRRTLDIGYRYKVTYHTRLYTRLHRLFIGYRYNKIWKTLDIGYQYNILIVEYADIFRHQTFNKSDFNGELKKKLFVFKSSESKPTWRLNFY